MVERILAAAFSAWRARRRPMLAALWLQATAALLFLLGGLYLSFAVYLALGERLGPPVAAALTAGLLLLLAISALLVALLVGRRPRRNGEDDAADLAEALVRAGELVGHKVEHPTLSLAATALLAGIVTGVSPAARRFLLNLAEQLFKEIKG